MMNVKHLFEIEIFCNIIISLLSPLTKILILKYCPQMIVHIMFWMVYVSGYSKINPDVGLHDISHAIVMRISSVSRFCDY